MKGQKTLRAIFLIFYLIVFADNRMFAQASFATIGTAYVENFNSLPNVTDGATLATWTNNTTLTGWYIDEGNAGATCGGTACDDFPTIEATTTTMNNGGNAYVYASGADRSLGSRSAGSTGTIYYGVRIKNNTASTITSIYVDYYGEQWTIAENQTNVNTIAFDYQIGATVTSLTAGTWTSVPSLGFTQIYTSSQSSGMGGTACAGSSAQCLVLDGNLTANRRYVAECITVAINPGDEIMLRWADSNDPANDHHMQIDDLEVWPYTVTCAVVLPVELLEFTARPENNSVQLNWTTSSETNNDFFTVERSVNGNEFFPIGFVNGNGTTTQQHAYSFRDNEPGTGVNYYQLRQTDYNGQNEVSPIVAVNFEQDELFSAQFFVSEEGLHFNVNSEEKFNLLIMDISGKIIYDQTGISLGAGTIRTIEWAKGVYIVYCTSKTNSTTQKVVLY